MVLRGSTKRKQRGWVPYGYKYLGPGNTLDQGKPTNPTDLAAQKHDWAYTFMERKGKKPKYTYSDSDDEFLHDIKHETDWASYPARWIFNAKKRLAENDWIEDSRKPKQSTLDWKTVFSLDSVTSKLVTDNASMSKSLPIGSGNDVGLTETPVDKPKRDIQRGPREHVFASLPYYQQREGSYASCMGVDFGWRMTSPLDPSIYGAAVVDWNVGTGTANTYSVEASDATDVTQVSARWFDWYSTQYNYYHCFGARYHITVENLMNEPIWMHTMFCNDEIPDMRASNEDIMCWRGVKSHWLGSHATAVHATTGIESNEDNANEMNIEGATTSGQTVNYETGNHIQSRGASPITHISGEYRSGQFNRSIHLDSEVENWTSVTANPALPERLIVRFKPYWNAVDTNNTSIYGRDLRFRYSIKIEYLVEFKELKYGLRYPIERQPVTATIVANQEEDEE